MNSRSLFKRTEKQIKTAWETIGTNARAEFTKTRQAWVIAALVCIFLVSGIFAFRSDTSASQSLSAIAQAVKDIYGEDNEIIRGVGGFQTGVDPGRALARIRDDYDESIDGEREQENVSRGKSFFCIFDLC